MRRDVTPGMAAFRRRQRAMAAHRKAAAAMARRAAERPNYGFAVLAESMRRRSA